MTTRRLISSGSTLEAQIGYSRAVVVGDEVLVSGTTGFDSMTMSISDELLAQTEPCFKNFEAALHRRDGLKKLLRVAGAFWEKGNDSLPGGQEKRHFQ